MSKMTVEVVLLDDVVGQFEPMKIIENQTLLFCHEECVGGNIQIHFNQDNNEIIFECSMCGDTYHGLDKNFFIKAIRRLILLGEDIKVENKQNEKIFLFNRRI